MMIKYQVKSRLKDGEWLEDHLPFNSIEDAQEYIKSQPKCFEYKVVVDEYEEE